MIEPIFYMGETDTATMLEQMRIAAGAYLASILAVQIPTDTVAAIKGPASVTNIINGEPKSEVESPD